MASDMMEEVRLAASDAAELAMEVMEERTEEAAEPAAEVADETMTATVEVTSAPLLLLAEAEEPEEAVALATAEVRMGRASGVLEAVAATPAQRA